MSGAAPVEPMASQNIALGQLLLTSFPLPLRWHPSAQHLRRAEGLLLLLAYLTADTATTYTLGHLAITSGSHVHQLVEFWTPFLLPHLGGQDTITAYALEDNLLSWCSSLESRLFSIGILSGSRGLITVGILMFIVGAAKYAERIWALKCTDNDGIDCLTDKYDAKVFNSAEYLDVEGNLVGFGMEEEVVMHGAHVLLSVCVSQFHDCTLKKTPLYQYKTLEYLVRSNKMYMVIEMELSLMYDMIYTKEGE